MAIDVEIKSKVTRREFRDLGTRDGFVGAIKDCGRYIVDNAENLLGEYPGSYLSELTVAATLRFDCLPTVVVTREHFAPVCDDEGWD